MDKTLKATLKGKLPKKLLDLVPSSYDTVGDLAIFSDFPEELVKKQKFIGETLLNLRRNIKVVLKKSGKYSGTYRTPQLRIIAGERRKETTLNENGIRLKLHPEKTYYSVRSGNERKRIMEQVRDGESILVMFSGIGPFSLVFSKHKSPKEIYSVEINPEACKYQKENILLNKSKNIKLYLGDVRKIVPKLNKRFDRILMPLPRSAEKFLDIALKAAKKNSVIHFYDFLHENDFNLAKEKIESACKKAKRKYRILNFIKCGQFGPGIFRICVDFKVL
ncbi:MAG: class I SAM-dependent methyltransferase family protein [Nanoarchaeota archaeon]|nr:class I SAM-dependent methyltransferase family protein [Nanoarchaeota archaeon]